MRCKLSVLLMLFLVKFLTAQNAPDAVKDSLLSKKYDYLDDKIYQHKNDSIKASPYLNAYLGKAKNEKNYREIVNGYKNMLHQSPMSLRLRYADSMVYAALKSKDSELLGSAYLSKGIVYYSRKNFIKAYDYYIKANEQISRSDNQYLIYKTKYHIAQIKYYLGFYDEAISLFSQCLSYFKKNEPRPYLNSLHSISVCYNRIGDYSRCSQTNEAGLKQCAQLEIPEMEIFFKHSEGVNQFFLNNYYSAIKILQEVIPQLDTMKEFANESIANFYIGKSYWKLHLPAKALPYFKKVDKAFNERGYIRQDLREVFELLIDFYKKDNNLNSQLYYMDQLLKADSLLTDTSRYLTVRIHKEYDTKEIITEKEKIHKQLMRQKYYDIILIGVVVVLFSAVIFGTWYIFEIKKRNRLKFDELLEKKEKKNTAENSSEKFEITDISWETVQLLLKQLEKFEKNKKFLDQDLTLAYLSAAFNTNTKYLSKVIYHHSGKRFVDYINDLKIDYLVELLKSSNQHRNYSISSLAEEAGFTTTPRFTNAFHSRAGISASYFLNQLKKESS